MRCYVKFTKNSETVKNQPPPVRAGRGPMGLWAPINRPGARAAICAFLYLTNRDRR